MKRQMCILTDEALANTSWNDPIHPWFFVLGASPPKVKGPLQREKDKNCGILLHDELKVGRRRSTTTSDREITQLWITFKVGPPARTCLKTVPATDNAAYKWAIEVYLGDVDRHLEGIMARGGY
ncbi:hypothetical protein HOY82DRAFT_607496 [Tuber indicum]|nr:hypothetical protein HOY82DRAFT_607496 [Tuber indicum]